MKGCCVSTIKMEMDIWIGKRGMDVLIFVGRLAGTPKDFKCYAIIATILKI
jgi:hypothetical protein